MAHIAPQARCLRAGNYAAAAQSGYHRPGMNLPAPATLRRALGRWDLTALGVNQVIGGAIFLVPSQVAAVVGAWSPIAIIGGALLTAVVALSMAEVGSRFDATGGPYLYARAAFGRFAAFEVGWMQWFARVSSHATIANGLAMAVGYYWAGAVDGVPRVAIILGITALLTALNVIGIQQGSRTVNALTIAKLVPLGLFIATGLFFVAPARFGHVQPVSLDQVTTAALLTIFMFGGYEVLTVPAGEARDPRRHIPFALMATVLVVGTVTVLAQVVAVGTLDDLAGSRTPLADAAAAFAGWPGALLIGLGGLAAMTGNLAGQVLTGSRMLYALAEQGDVPGVFRYVHPSYRTPVVSIVFTAAVAAILALSGSFAALAVASAMSRVVIYGASCAAAVVLAMPRFAGRAGPASFLTPGHPIIPLAGTLTCVALLLAASRSQLVGGGAALAAGALLFGATRLGQRHAGIAGE